LRAAALAFSFALGLLLPAGAQAAEPRRVVIVPGTDITQPAVAQYLLVAASLASIAITPLAVSLCGRIFGFDVEIPARRIAWVVGVPSDRTVLALATTTRHPGTSLNFPGEKGALAVILYHLVIGSLVAIPYIRWRRSLAGDAARGTRGT